MDATLESPLRQAALAETCMSSVAHADLAELEQEKREILRSSTEAAHSHAERILAKLAELALPD